MHPVDLLYGTVLPHLQFYYVAGPPIRPDMPSFQAHVEQLIQGRFPRLAYRQANHLVAGRSLHLAEDLLAPVRRMTLEEFLATPAEQLRAVGDRFWNLFLIESDELTTLSFTFGHWLVHGTTARRFMYEALDGLYPDKRPGTPPTLSPSQWSAYREFQRAITESFRAEHDFAEYRALTFDLARVNRLHRSIGQSFTDMMMMWLSRTVLDVAPRQRPLEIVSFRMDRQLDIHNLFDPAFGNEGLMVELWKMLPDGFYSSIDPSQGLGEQKVNELVEFYGKVPLKGAFLWFVTWQIQRNQLLHQQHDQERLVINNLGHTDHPFFRGMFFDPFNDIDALGLVFVDSVDDQLTLQFAPPKKFLERFSWSAFEERLAENLTGMLADTRLQTR